jgi:hypothetical protein
MLTDLDLTQKLSGMETDLRGFVERHDRKAAETASRLQTIEQSMVGLGGAAGSFSGDDESIGDAIVKSEGFAALPVDAAGHASAPDLARQADIYRAIASACLAHAGCTAIQTWGFTDKYSWIGWKTNGAKGNALLFDRYYEPKPAFDALAEACGQVSPVRPLARPRSKPNPHSQQL